MKPEEDTANLDQTTVVIADHAMAESRASHGLSHRSMEKGRQGDRCSVAVNHTNTT